MTAAGAGASTRPSVSVVVPFHQSERHIRACIESLLDQADVEGVHEIVLIDNGSTDRSAAIASDYSGLSVLDERTPGAYAARNAGIRRATAPLIALTDADCVVDRNWISRIQAGMRDPSTAILIGQCRYADEASIVLKLLGMYENAKAEYVISRASSAHHFAYANNMAVRSSVFAGIGLFKEWPRAADSELVHRLGTLRPDLRVVYDPTVRITHLEFLSARARGRRLALYAHTNSKIPTFRELGFGQRLDIARRLIRQLLRHGLQP